MMRKRGSVPVKKRVYLGCEGDSEVAYGQLLNDFLNDAGIAIHLVPERLNPGAGDPQACVRKAIARIRHLNNMRSPSFTLAAVLIDHDRVQDDAPREQSVQALAAKHAIHIIWQRPSHEALLLRHLPNCADRRPPTSNAAMKALQANWDGYRKPMTRQSLALQIAFRDVVRAVSVEPELRAFLQAIRLVP
jgi:hypothetical protein